MAKKRGTSGLCLVVGVDKPVGMSSHDVVNRVRRIFGERRVGHTGTLDPMASGVLTVCVGPAARLDAYLTGHDKTYVARIVFGTSTETDDVEGETTATAPVPAELFDSEFARAYLSSIVGARKQIPPVYSALKVGGKKACDEARRGNVIEIEPRDIVVYQAELIDMGTMDDPWWDVRLKVSAGTYIRAIARDAGIALGTVAHLGSLRRTEVGNISLDDCVKLETLEEVGESAAIDPVMLLGCRFAFADGALSSRIENGNTLPADLRLCCKTWPKSDIGMCACTSGVMESDTSPVDGELVSVISVNRLKAIYRYNEKRGQFESACVFNVGVRRGADI